MASINSAFQASLALLTINQGRRAPLRFALAPWLSYSRLWRSGCAA